MKTEYKLILIGLGALYCFYYFSTLDQWHFIDSVNLLIHEAGHVIFLPFGEFLTIAGGSLMQLIVPSLFVGYFIKTGQKYSAAITMYWLAINFFSVGHYASDAVLMQLPLLGGDNSGHDWHNMLLMTGLLNQTKIIAGLIFVLGFACIFAALYFTYRQAAKPEQKSP